MKKKKKIMKKKKKKNLISLFCKTETSKNFHDSQQKFLWYKKNLLIF